jgi:DNA-binding MarR family transcriptional regulator
MTTPPPAGSLAELLGRISARTRQTMHATMNGAYLRGLTPQQARVLGYIEANEAGGIVARDIAARMGTRPASVSGLLAGLEDDGWIVRRPDPGDSRRKTLHVTDKGRGLVSGFEAGLWAAMDSTLVGALSPDEHATLVALLTKLDQALAD